VRVTSRDSALATGWFAKTVTDRHKISTFLLEKARDFEKSAYIIYWVDLECRTRPPTVGGAAKNHGMPWAQTCGRAPGACFLGRSRVAHCGRSFPFPSPALAYAADAAAQSRLRPWVRTGWSASEPRLGCAPATSSGDQFRAPVDGRRVRATHIKCSQANA
jgi:hypothetical protein